MEIRKDEELAGRLLKFAVLIIQLCGKLPNNAIGNHIRTQLQRCGTSLLPVLNECEELTAIIAKSIFTARKPQTVK
jgi:hypothetical protein